MKKNLSVWFFAWCAWCAAQEVKFDVFTPQDKEKLAISNSECSFESAHLNGENYILGKLDNARPLDGLLGGVSVLFLKINNHIISFKNQGVEYQLTAYTTGITPEALFYLKFKKPPSEQELQSAIAQQEEEHKEVYVLGQMEEYQLFTSKRYSLRAYIYQQEQVGEKDTDIGELLLYDGEKLLHRYLFFHYTCSF